MAWPTNAAPMPPVSTVSQPATTPMPSDDEQHAAAAPGRAEARGQRVEDGLEGDGQVGRPVEGEQQAQDDAAEGGLVDEGGADGVEQPRPGSGGPGQRQPP